MTKKVLQGILLLFLIAKMSYGQEQCPFPPANVKPYVDGHPDSDSISVGAILGAGKLATKISGLQVVSFHIATGNGCVGGGGMYSEIHCNSNDLTGEAAFLLKRAPGRKFYFDHVHAVNRDGKMFCLKPTSIFVKKSNEPEPCSSLPVKAYVAGRAGATKVKLSEMRQMALDAQGYEIISFKLSFCGPAIAGYQEILNKGAVFSADIRQAMTRLEAGQQFGFNDILVKDRAGKTFCLDNVVLALQAE